MIGFKGRLFTPNIKMKLFLIPTLLFVFSLTLLAQYTISLEGQVVCCADCWAEADRTKVEFGTAEDILKAKSCVDGGDPTLLAVLVGDKFTLYQLEEGKFRLTEKNWYSYIGKKVAVTGTKRKNKKADAFVVDTLTITAPSIAERESREAVGKDASLTSKDLFGADVSLTQFKGPAVTIRTAAVKAAIRVR